MLECAADYANSVAAVRLSLELEHALSIALAGTACLTSF